MSRCELVVFDWDGTLMDSVDRIVDSWQRACAELSIGVSSADAVRSIIGLSLESAIEALIPELESERMAPFIKAYRSWYLDRSDVPTPLFDGVEELLHELKGQGYPLAVATGKGRPGLERVLDTSGLRPLFDASRTPTEAASKPHPDMILQLCQELGSSPQRTVMVGDALFDLEMANRAGAVGIGVSYGAGAIEQLRSASPKGIIHRPMELLELL